MLSLQEQVSRATQEHVESQLLAGTTLADVAIDGVHSVADLHLNIARAALQHSNLAVRQLATAEDPRRFVSLGVAQMAPASGRGLDYGYLLTTILSKLQGDVLQFARISIAGNNRKWMELASLAGTVAPVAQSAVLSVLRSTLENFSACCSVFSQQPDALTGAAGAA